MSGISGRTSVPQPPPTKTVVMYRNGDAFFPGRKFVINQRHMSTFDTFLGSVTQRVEAPFGAVRNVYTPRDGHRILDLEHLQHGERYVAAGAERFKKLDYLHITTKKPQRKKNELIRPVIHSRIIVSARWKKVLHESCTINVFTNGDILVPPARILIPKYTLRNWDRVLAMVTEKVHLRTGAVHRLCMLDGTPLLGSVELEHNQYYVAVGTEKFKLLPYFQWVPSKGTMRDTGHGFYNALLPPLRKDKIKDMYSPEGGDSDSAILSSPLQSMDRRGPSIGHLRDHTDSFFYAKEERAKQSKQSSKFPNLLSTGEGSVFKAKHKRKETQGAYEVQEDSHMKVDLPIDQVIAKIVEEEQIDSGNQLQKEHKARESRSPYKILLKDGKQASIPSIQTTPSPQNTSDPKHPPKQDCELSGDFKKTSADISQEQHRQRQRQPKGLEKNEKDSRSANSSLKKRHKGGRSSTSLTATDQELPGSLKEEAKEQERFSNLFGIRLPMSDVFKDKTKK
ncbi:doublecortin domain-containing protein 2C isoform X2 [Lepisosteus oculatus]|uniref:doublecortin domain-containing protein 2C isoform X2 n=1 Tax=Lepisosteus oculatus TaxID=7918 RepID=UPI0035F5186D